MGLIRWLIRAEISRAEGRGRAAGYELGLKDCTMLIDSATRRIINGDSTDSKINES
jgi:hypothetical protein